MEKETIYRLTEDDFRCVAEDNHPEMTAEQIEAFVEHAHQRFEIHDWAEYVDAHLTTYLEGLK